MESHAGTERFIRKQISGVKLDANGVALLMEMAKSSSVESAKGMGLSSNLPVPAHAPAPSIQPSRGDGKSMALAGVTYLTSPLVDRWEIALQRLAQNYRKALK